MWKKEQNSQSWPDLHMCAMYGTSTPSYSFIKILKRLIFIYMHVCESLYMRVQTRECRYLQRPEDTSRSLVAGVRGGC